jgi:hypothetical protein
MLFYFHHTDRNIPIYVPDKIPDHSLLLCDITLDHDQILNSITNNKDVNRERFKLSNVPNDFLTGPEIARQVNETIERIENSLRVSQVTTIGLRQYMLD